MVIVAGEECFVLTQTLVILIMCLSNCISIIMFLT